MNDMPRKIEISHRTIIFTFFLIGFLWLLFLIRDLILQLFMAVFIATIFDPYVTKLSFKGVPRTLAVLFIYVLVIGVLSLAIASIVPALVEQTHSFFVNFPTFLSKIGISSFFSGEITTETLNQLGAVPSKIAATTVSIFSNIFQIITVLVFSFYILSEKRGLYSQITSLFGPEKEKEINGSIVLVEKRIGNWSRAELILMVTIGLLNYIGLKLLGIPFALPLAILAGLLEIIPYIGPIIAAVPAVIIGFGISPVIGIATAAMSTLIQQLENYVLVPKVMQTNVGVNPVVTLICIAIGARLAGIAGVIIAVPVYISVEVLLLKYFSTSNNQHQA